MASFIVAGVPGVGKTTTLQGLATPLRVKIETFSELMWATPVASQVAASRDGFRSVPQEVLQGVQALAARRASSFERIVLDTHFTVRLADGSGYLALPTAIVQRLNPVGIALLEASPDEILRRRLHDLDVEKRRDEEDSPTIAKHQHLNRINAMLAAAASGVPIECIVNHDKRQDEARRHLSMVIRTAFDAYEASHTPEPVNPPPAKTRPTSLEAYKPLPRRNQSDDNLGPDDENPDS